MAIRVILLLIIFLVLSVAAGALSADPATIPSTVPTPAPSRSVLDGVYSTEQVARGEKAYFSSCARCHGDNLLGNDDASALVDNDFLGHWYGKSVGNLVDLTWKKMPTDGPGKLSRKQCTDMAAYLLNQNGYPVGKSDLVSDADVLKNILIEAKK